MMHAFRNHPSRVIAFLAVCLTPCLCASVHAANPRVTLKLRNVNGAEAVEALAKASKVPIRYEDYFPRGEERASFDWTGVPLAQAMREMGARLHVYFRSAMDEAGYLADLFPRDYETPSGRVSTERNGARIWVTEVIARSSSSANWITRDRQAGSGLQLRFGVELPGKDGDTVTRIANVTARDDLGNVLFAPGGNPSHWRLAPFPDQWFGGIGLGQADPRAHKLLWLEGEIELSSPLPENVVSIPVPPPPGRDRYHLGSLSVEVKKLTPPRSGEQGSIDLVVSSPALEFRPGRRISPGVAIQFDLIGASGKERRVYGSRNSIREAAAEYRLRLSDIPEKVTEIRITEARDEDRAPEATIRFRLNDIPLPEDGTNFDQREPPRASARKVPEHALFDLEGGSLSGAARVSGGKVPLRLTGSVGYGLSPVLADRHAGVQWMDVPLEADGSGKLIHLEPGKYRVLRAYRPDVEPRLPQPGRWLNSETIVEIQAGRETVLPPLEWAPDALPPGK